MAFRGVDVSGITQAHALLADKRAREAAEAERIRLEKKREKEAKKARKKASRINEFQTIGTLIGAVAGGVAAGPAGIGAGATIGATVGGGLGGQEIGAQQLVGAVSAGAGLAQTVQTQQTNAELARITVGERADAVNKLRAAKIAQLGVDLVNRQDRVDAINKQFEPASAKLNELAAQDNVDPRAFDLELKKFDRKFGINPDAVGNEQLKGLFNAVKTLDKENPEQFIEGMNQAINQASLIESRNTPTVLKALESQRDNFVNTRAQREAVQLKKDTNEFLRTKKALQSKFPNLSEGDLTIATDDFINNRKFEQFQKQQQSKLDAELSKLTQKEKQSIEIDKIKQQQKQESELALFKQKEILRAVSSTDEFALEATNLFGKENKDFIPSPLFMTAEQEEDVKKSLALKQAALKKPDAEKHLRNDYVQRSKNFTLVHDAKAKIDILAKEDSAVPNIALITSFMKLIDPGAIVTKQDFEAVATAAGVSDRVINLGDKVFNGEILTDEQRREIAGVANGIYQSKLASHRQDADRFIRLARHYNLSPEAVIFDSDIFDKDIFSKKEALDFGSMNPQQLKAVDPENLSDEDLDKLLKALGRP